MVFLILANAVIMNFSIHGTIYLILLIILLRVKYHVNYAFQKSVGEIHFMMDKTFKKFQLRSAYHKFYKLLVNIFMVKDYYYQGKKIIKY